MFWGQIALAFTGMTKIFELLGEFPWQKDLNHPSDESSLWRIGFILLLAWPVNSGCQPAPLQMTVSEENTTTVGSEYSEYPPAESSHSLSQGALLHVFSNASVFRNLSFSYFSHQTPSCFFLFMLFVVGLWSCLGPFRFGRLLFKRSHFY